MPSLKANGKRLNGSRWIATATRLAIYLRDRFTCAYCGTDLTDKGPRDISLDHLRPVCRGGSHASTNLTTACFTCNSLRKDQPWRTFAPPGSVERILRQRRKNLKPFRALAKAILAGSLPKAEALKAAESR